MTLSIGQNGLKKRFRVARPKKGFDLTLIEKLAAIHCTNTEIAATIGCSISLLSKPSYSKIIAKGKEVGKISLRKKMYETAMSGNVTMQIWLSKQQLGMSDKIEQRNQLTVDPVMIYVPKNGSESDGN